METKLLMGNEAIALGAIRAGVQVVSGYPGTPSTEVLETVAKAKHPDVYVEWSVNEKVALEVAAGAAYSGARTMVTMKQVGLNVASDPLMSLAYIGVRGGMVILVADDPGPISSQTEQDTRHFAQFANLPVFDPTTVEDAYDMIVDAFEFSEKYHVPVIFRPTTRVCHSCASIAIKNDRVPRDIPGFARDPKWVIFPKLSYARHVEIEKIQREMANDLSSYPRNAMDGNGKLGIVASGVSYTYVKEALELLDVSPKLLRIATANPFPDALALSFLHGLERVLVLEELDPVVEEALLQLCGAYHLPVEICGKHSGHLPYAGEYSTEIARGAIADFYHITLEDTKAEELPPLPIRPPVLCAGCPHRASFYAVKCAMHGQRAVFTGDIGCYTLGNAKPLDMVDTCLCMGAGVTIAQGLARTNPGTHAFAFIGDSTFFHTGIPGVINAVYNQTDMTLVVLDNSTTAMTGHQPHPGTGKTMMGAVSDKIDIAGMLVACGVSRVETVNPLNFETAVETVRDLAKTPGVTAVIFRSPCIALFKPEARHIVSDTCIGCQKCIREIGCPALFVQDGSVKIDSATCYGCGLCAKLCPVSAIVEEGK